MFGAGATGFFAVPYAALMYPVLFMAFPRLWSVAHRHGYVTAADFVRGRFGHRGLALAVAVTGLVAVMPYIALQLVGMQVVIAALGLDYAVHLPLLGTVSVPLIAAFAVLAAFTYTSGPARHRPDRGGQGHPGLCHRAGGDHHHPGAAGRLRQDFRRRAATASVAGAGAGRQPGRGLCLCHPGAGLAAGAVPLSPFGDRPAVVLQPPCHPPQRHGAARLFGGFGADRAAGLHGDGVGREGDAGICRRLQKLRQQFRGAGAVPAHVPRLVRGRRLCRHRHRRAGARLDHGDRLRQPFHPQHLQGVHRAGLLAPGRSQGRQAGGLRRQAGGAVLCAGIADHLCHPAAVAGRHLDLPDGAGGAAGAVCAA